MKLIPLFILASLLIALPTKAGPTIEGDIKLVYSKDPFSKETFRKEFGGVVKATTSWHVGEFFGKETIFAGITVTNTSSKPMFFQYYVAFYDKDKKLVGVASQGSFGDQGLAPKEQTQLGSCLVHLPKDRYKDIVSYQAIIYETDVAPKKN